MIKQGQTRIVFLVGNYAIKIPNFLKGYKQFLYGLISNLQEKEFSRTNPYLLPVKHSLFGSLIVIMPRCIVLDKNLPLKAFYVITTSLGVYPKVDYKPESFGIWKGRVYVIDYGTTV